MAKFKVGDRVKIVKVEADFAKLLGEVGEIVDVDEIWDYPYEVKFDKQKLNDEAEGGWLQSLFCDKEIALESDKIFHMNDDYIVVLPADGEAIKVPTTATSFINIKFQEGTVEENGVNGVQIEDVIDVLVKRLEGFQKGGFPCRENALAITKLEEARMWLNERTRKRKEQGVEGRYEKHDK